MTVLTYRPGREKPQSYSACVYRDVLQATRTWNVWRSSPAGSLSFLLSFVRRVLISIVR